MEKLIKIQSELKAPKNQYNAFGKYKYRNAEDILEAVKPLLLKHGCSLVLSDSIKEIGGMLFCDATAVFYDGNERTIVSAQAGIDPHRKGMDIAQSFGSSSSYARKYALNGLFLIDDTKDPDTQPPKETLKRNSVSIPAELLKTITEGLRNAETLDDVTKLYNDNKQEIVKHPSLKAMFTSKKLAFNGNH